MDNQDDEHLLSTLGVTTANPEDIERDVIAAAEESGRRKKRLESEAEEETEVQAEGEDDWDGESRHEAMLRNRLEALDQEINAVAAGLQSLGQENRDEASTQDANAGEEEEKPQLPEEENIHSVEGLHLQRALGQEENIHSVEGLHLQRALGQERLASLKEKRGRLFQKLTTLESGLPDGSENDDDLRVTDATDAQTESRKVKFVKSADHKQKSLLTLEDDEFDFALDSTSGFVETERDRLIRTGVVTPFDRLKGFERRVKRTSSNGPITSQAETSIANAAASMAAIVKSRPTTKLLDASELPKLAPPTREFHRIRRVQRYAGPQEKSDKAMKGQVKQGKKRKRPMPDMKWRKRNRSESDGEVSFPEGQIGAASSGSEEGEVEEAKSSKERRGSKEESGFESQVEMDLKGPGDGGNMEDDVWLEGGLQIPSLIYNKLFDYQKTGVKWLWELHCQKAGGIIADEMGLGKTIQVAAFLASLHHSGLYKPSIVVCPVTLLRQWKRELQKWYGFFEVEILHDSAILHSRKSSKSRRGKAKDDESSDDGEGEGEEEREDVKPTPTKHANKWGALIERIVNSKSGLLVTTYEQLRILRELLLGHEWGYAVLDEGHRIRNPDAEVTLVCKQLQTVHRIIMTGAPIQNRLTELWSLFDFVFPGKLGVLPVFQAQFALPIAIGGYANATPLQVSTAYKCAVVLRDLIMPYLLRRLKSDVNAHLTKKTEHVLFCSLSEEQRSAYRAFLGSSEVEQIFDGNRNSLYGIDILRKICNHADLLEREHSANHPDYGNPERSGKLRVVAQVLDLWKIQGHRVLIFSQTQQMLDIIENYIISKDFTYRRMDGSTPVQQRMALIDEFNESSHVFVFILTTRVGGLGTNLIGANKVIIFDPDWNPSTDMQARERAWRIGQTRDVTIYRLITRGTIEEKVYHRQIYKHFLTNKILKDPKQRRVFKAKDLRDLFTLNEEKHESKTETSALFAELANVELSNENKQVQAPVNSMHGFGEEQEKILVRSAVKGKAPVEDDESYEDESRILKCLFEANGIHSALNHDAIESMNDLEKMKVDNESARVAQQAATAVMQSRLQRSGDNVAVPTWTGRSGAAGAPVAVRRRFGSTMNTRLISSSTAGGSNGSEVPGSTIGGASRTETVVAGVAGSSIGRALSSTDVLARIRGRVGSGVETARPYSNGMPNGVREGSRSRDERPVQRGLEPDILIRQLRTFIEHNGGSVSSTLIVAKFKDVVPASNVAVFRQLLKEVAILRKEGTEGRWVLKDENQS